MLPRHCCFRIVIALTGKPFCRFMMQELMYFRQQVFHHIKQDWSDVLSRSMSLWCARSCCALSCSRLTPCMYVCRSPRTRDGRQLYSHSHSNHSAALAPLAAAAETSPDGEGLLVQDMALLDLWIPGKIIHIFSHNGQYRACMVTAALSLYSECISLFSAIVFHLPRCLGTSRTFGE